MEQRAERGRSLWLQSWQRLRRKKVAMGALVLLVIIYMAGLFAPWVSPYGMNEQNLDAAWQGPSLEHPLGTDRLGRDLLSRLIWGARTASIISLAAVFTGSLFLGILVGGIAGYMGRWVDTLIMRVGDLFLAFPSMLLVIFMAATLKPRVTAWVRAFEARTGFEGIVVSGAVDYFVVFGALSLIGWVGMARLVRGQILSLKETQFVEAARALGAPTSRIILVHLLPNSLGPVLVSLSMTMAGLVTSEVVLSWLGVGIQPPNASWGQMIWENAGMLRAQPHLLLMPSFVVGLVIFAWNLLGDGLNDALNPRTR